MDVNRNKKYRPRYPFAFGLGVGILLLVVGCGPSKQEMTDAAQAYDYQAALQNYKIGVNYLNNEDIHKAIEHLEMANDLDSSNFRYHHTLGLAYSLNGQLEKAVAELEASMAINPNFGDNYNLLGTILIDKGDYDRAESVLRKAITDPNYGQPHFAFFNLGLCREAQGREAEAVAAYQRATQLEPKFYRAFVALAELYKRREDYTKALYYYREAEPGFANDVSVLFEIGHALFKLRKFDEAKNYLAQVSILFPPPNIDGPTQDMLTYIEKVERKK